MNDNVNEDRRKKGAMERHLQSAVMFVLLGVLSWGGWNLQQLRDSSITQTAQITGLREQVSDLSRRFNDYPTRVEVQARFDAVDSKVQDDANRVDRLERRLGQ